MIHIRKNPFSESSIEIPFKENENAKELICRALELVGYGSSDNMLFHFQVVVNGLIVDRDFWESVSIVETDNVLIGPRITRGSGGQLFKTVAIVAIAVAASIATKNPAFGLSAAEAAFATAAITIAGTLALNALIPPPALPGLEGLGGFGQNFSESQMYSISGQANTVKKFGYVHKVYGRHRIFPTIAANPYTELETDTATGTLVQYYYGIFDFGLGPMNVYDIRIGDTPLTQYTDVKYRLVDINKPLVSEGPWDDAVYSTFQFYKGDFQRDGTTYVLDKNQSGGGPLSEYQVIRTASERVQGSKQEIILDFTCPQGLTAYSTNGTTGTRSIDVKVEFSKVGENIWRAFNDVAYVDDYSSTGGTNVLSDVKGHIVPVSDFGVGGDYQTLSVTNLGIEWTGSEYEWNIMYRSEIVRKGWKAGTNKIPLLSGEAQVTDGIYLDGNLLGVVASVSPSPYPGYSYYNLDRSLSTDVMVLEVRLYYGAFDDVLFGGAITNVDTLTDPDPWGSRIKIRKLTLGSARISANTTNPHYATIKFSPKEVAQFKVRITRETSYSQPGYTYRTFDKLTLISLTTRFDREPIRTEKRHVFLEVRIKATNQINGVIQNLSATVESILDVYNSNTQQWEKQNTSNPAWVYCDILTGEVNKRAIDKSRLHLPSIVEWAEFCDQVPVAPPSQDFALPRFTCNFVLDFNTTLQSLVNSVTNSAQASLNIVDGKYGVLIDKNKTIPVQIFTPRNSWDFSSSRSYNDAPHALKIRYVEPQKSWEIVEIIVYDTGYDENNAEIFEELSTFACTNFEQAWRFGRYMLAQSRLRKERITLRVDFEHLVCTRGDFVQITQDVMRVGGRPARVKSVSGNIVKIDDGIDTLPMLDYGYVYRSVADGIQTSTLTVIDSDEFELDGGIPAVGDLIIIGEVDKIVFNCLVKSITPDSDLSAVVELVEKADAIYTAESSDTLPDYTPQISTNVDSSQAAPPAVEDLEVVANTWRVVGGAYEYYIDLDWNLPAGAAFETYEIYVDNGQGYDLVDFTKNSDYEYIVDENDLGILHSFKVLAVSSTGKKISLIDAPFVTATPLEKLTPPSDVEALYLNITNEVLQLDWTPVLDADLREYLIRFSPKSVGATWEASIPLLRVDRNTTMASTQARTGTYFIKALDLNYNESIVSARAITTIPNLFNLNIIAETNDFPLLEGELVTTEDDGVGLVLQRLVVGNVLTNEYYPEGYYYYSEFLDLGEIYTVRLQSLIEAEGFTIGDLMSNWPDLSTLTAMSLAGQSDWDVETYYRATDNFNVISEWASLDLVDPLSEGEQDLWTPWTKFTMGDFTGRIFQFRLKLISNAAFVTPRVYEGIIRADMPDRVESYNNLIAPPSGLSVAYTPAFKGPGTSPNIQITQDSASQGDYYVISNKTLDGFDIVFYDKDGIAVTRQFDVAIKGFGRKANAVI